MIQTLAPSFELAPYYTGTLLNKPEFLTSDVPLHGSSQRGESDIIRPGSVIFAERCRKYTALLSRMSRTSQGTVETSFSYMHLWKAKAKVQ